MINGEVFVETRSDTQRFAWPELVAGGRVQHAAAPG